MTDEGSTVPRYLIDIDLAEKEGRSMASLVAARKCYMCRQADEGLPVSESSPEEHIAKIEEECSGTGDYLLPDTPLKEAVFRVILAHGNLPMTARQISEDLSERWAVSPYPRDVSPPVLSRLLETSGGYPISPLQDTGQDETVEEPAAVSPEPAGASETSAEAGGGESADVE